MRKLFAAVIFASLLFSVEVIHAEPASTQPTTRGDRASNRPQVEVNADHADWNYVTGERVKFTIAAPAGTKITYAIGPDMMPADTLAAVIPASGTLELEGGTLNDPGFLRCVVTAPGFGRGLATAAFSPEKIKPTQTEPADFDAFWGKAKEELAKVPMDARLTPLPQYTNDKVEAFEVNLQNIGTPPARTSRFYGILLIPRGAGPFPAMISPPGAGVRGPGIGNNWAENGFITLAVGVHEMPVVPTQEFPTVKAPSDYPTVGLDSPDHYYFRRVIMGCLRADDFLASLPKWDHKDLIACSGSQGGYLSITTTALDPRVTACVASFPAYCDVTGYIHGRAGGWPKLKFDDRADPQRDAKIATTTYFDGVNFARRIKVPGHYGWGYNDETCPPDSTFSAYNVITAPKQLTIIKEMGHPRVQALTDAEHAWILAHLASR